MALTELLQFRKGLGLQSVPLMFHVAERRADKHSNDGVETGCGGLLRHEVWCFLFIPLRHALMGGAVRPCRESSEPSPSRGASGRRKSMRRIRSSFRIRDDDLKSFFGR